MDGFDDLLAGSRLEDNPFSDPFSKRSNSPDPWASAFVQRDAHTELQDEPDHSTTPPIEHQPPLAVERDEASTLDTFQASSLEPTAEPAVVALNGSKLEPSGYTVPARSPGFRESVALTFSEIATIRPQVTEDNEPSIPTPVRVPTPKTNPPSPSTSSLQSKDATYSAQRSLAASPSPSAPRSERDKFTVSPLVQKSAPLSLDQSFSGLALGGEVPGGWQNSQNSWGNTPSLPSARSEEDSDDDKPIGQRLVSREDSSSRQVAEASPPPARPNPSGIQPVFVITVDDPQKVGDPIRSFTMYTVHTRTTSPLFQKSAFSVLRRYSDFLWLYETLSINNPGVVVPPVPEKNPFGRFDDQFVRQRRFALEKCIQKIANHPVLGKDADLKMFLESDSFALDIKHRKAEIAHERGGLIATIGQSITGPRFHETDEWFDRQKAYLDGLESQLRSLVKAIELASKQRSELSIAIGELGQSLSDLSSSDMGKQLSQSLAGLADVERKAQELQETQSQQDVVTLLSTVDEYARLINSVRLAFSSRIRTYHSWRNADADLLRTKQTHEKNRAQGRIPADRLGHSLSQIAEAERRAMDAKQEFAHVSKLIKTEVARFEQERIEDFKDSLHAFLEGMIARQKELIGAWEDYQQKLLKKVGTGKGTMQAIGTAATAASPSF